MPPRPGRPPAAGPELRAPASWPRRPRATAPGAATNVCSITATSGLGSCTDSSAGLTASTSYTYAVFSKIGASWVSAGSLSVNATTDAPGDTTAPTLTPNCPTTGHGDYRTNSQGSGSWDKDCKSAASLNATDAVGVVSAAVKITKPGTQALCWSGTAFTADQCTAPGPTGYPEGYIAATHGSGNVWSVTIHNGDFNHAGNGTFAFAGQAKDAAGNTSATLTVSFTTS